MARAKCVFCRVHSMWSVANGQCCLSFLSYFSLETQSWTLTRQEVDKNGKMLVCCLFKKSLNKNHIIIVSLKEDLLRRHFISVIIPLSCKLVVAITFNHKNNSVIVWSMNIGLIVVNIESTLKQQYRMIQILKKQIFYFILFFISKSRNGYLAIPIHCFYYNYQRWKESKEKHERQKSKVC